jgi:hypothetical protein
MTFEAGEATLCPPDEVIARLLLKHLFVMRREART